jgi:hypothetical protein
MNNIKQEPPQKIVYEWLLTRVNAGDVILTENQYEFYKNQVLKGDMREIRFRHATIRPSYVISGIRKQASFLKDKYPCKSCYSSGRKSDNTEWCSSCGGSGVQLPK